MGDKWEYLLRRCAGLTVLAQLVALGVTACLAEPRQPDLSTREEFAQRVMAAAVSGSAESVVALVDPALGNAGPQAQQLVDSTRGWTPGSWRLGISNDFPEVANVTASRDGEATTVRYVISWTDDRWTLALGEPKNRPGGSVSGGAKPIGPGSDPKVLPGVAIPPGPTSRPTSLGQPPAVCPDGAGVGVAPGPGYGAAALACRKFTSIWGSARGQNMSWLTSAPLHLSFDAPGGVLTMVVRMPCGVLNVPVSVDDFGLVPERTRIAESADGCAGPEADQRSWTRAYFQVPSVYHLDSSELVLTNELGQIRFKQD